MTGKTVIVVAHRLSTIAHLDRIVVFDQGRVVEDGLHAELLALRGAYYRLWSRQSDGFLPKGGNGAARRSPVPAEELGAARPIVSVLADDAKPDGAPPEDARV